MENSQPPPRASPNGAATTGKGDCRRRIDVCWNVRAFVSISFHWPPATARPTPARFAPALNVRASSLPSTSPVYWPRSTRSSAEWIALITPSPSVFILL